MPWTRYRRRRGGGAGRPSIASRRVVAGRDDVPRALQPPRRARARGALLPRVRPPRDGATGAIAGVERVADVGAVRVGALQARSIITPVPIRPRSRGERRSLRTFSPGVSLRPSPLGFDPRRASTPHYSASDAPLNSTPTSPRAGKHPHQSERLRVALHRGVRLRSGVGAHERRAGRAHDRARGVQRGGVARGVDALAVAAGGREGRPREGARVESYTGRK
jgi:hypothetical protein